MSSTKLNIRSSPLHGIGVFAATNISQGELVEVCPIILLNEVDTKSIDTTKLYNYYFSWDKGSAIALGYGSLYNHSYTPNISYEKDYSSRTIRFIALRDIAIDEELCSNYNGTPESQEKVWFEKE